MFSWPASQAGIDEPVPTLTLDELHARVAAERVAAERAAAAALAAAAPEALVAVPPPAAAPPGGTADPDEPGARAARAAHCLRGADPASAVITGEGKAEVDKSPPMTEKQVQEALRFKTGNGDYGVIVTKEASMSRKNAKDIWNDMAAAVNACDPSNKHVYTAQQVKTKVNNIRSRYQAYQDKISRSGEENVWRTNKKPFWWADAEALWATREATKPSVVLEAGMGGVKMESDEPGAAAAPEEEERGQADAAAPAPVAKARESDVARRAAAQELRAARKTEKKTALLKEQAAVFAEAQRGQTQELLAGLTPFFGGLTEALKSAVNLQERAVQLQERLLRDDTKKKKRKRHSQAASSPSCLSSDSE